VVVPRQHHITSRTREYFDRRNLRSHTGRSESYFAEVVVKELLDDALDAAETAGVAPEIGFDAHRDGDNWVIALSDNGGGMSEDLIRSILDFNVLVSDKSAYVSPTRGQQGNGLKTVIGIPTALDGTEPIIIESLGRRHTIASRIDATGDVHIDWQTERVLPRRPGTTWTVTLPAAGQILDPQPRLIELLQRALEPDQDD
jgi:DNA topoisomerase VI subunit B